jgi:GntR family transcriptional regulator, transcriptional repressor for pyruvate dehydrogenase complex
MSKTRDAIEDLKALLLTGEVQAGERLPPEAHLAERLGISRNVLREAVRALVHGGVLITRQGDGTYMAPLEPSELLDGVALYTRLATGSRLLQVLEARRTIEPELTALAATRMDAESLAELDRLVQQMADPSSERELVDSDVAFHKLIADASGNELLAGFLDALAPVTVRPRVWRALVDAGSLDGQLHQHRSIADAIRARDPQAARAAAIVHLADVARFFAEHVDGLDADEVVVEPGFGP